MDNKDEDPPVEPLLEDQSKDDVDHSFTGKPPLGLHYAISAEQAREAIRRFEEAFGKVKLERQLQCEYVPTAPARALEKTLRFADLYSPGPRTFGELKDARRLQQRNEFVFIPYRQPPQSAFDRAFSVLDFGSKAMEYRPVRVHTVDSSGGAEAPKSLWRRIIDRLRHKS